MIKYYYIHIGSYVWVDEILLPLGYINVHHIDIQHILRPGRVI